MIRGKTPQAPREKKVVDVLFSEYFRSNIIDVILGCKETSIPLKGKYGGDTRKLVKKQIHPEKGINGRLHEGSDWQEHTRSPKKVGIWYGWKGLRTLQKVADP